jgi:hypothetical protein
MAWVRLGKVDVVDVDEGVVFAAVCVLVAAVFPAVDAVEPA